MSNPWDAELELTPEAAAKLITDQFPQLAPARIRLAGQGFDNTVFKVNDKYIFRFPRRNIAESLLQTENVLLPRLKKTVSMPIPEPLFFGKACPEYPWGFTGYKAVPGKTPYSLTDSQRLQSVVPAALFLKSLHQFPVETAKDLRVPYDELNRLSIGKRKAKLEENVRNALEADLIKDEASVKKYLANLRIVEAGPSEVLVHGDLHFKNVLVNEHGWISGIIDWGDVHIGNPAVDLSFAYQFLPPEGRNEFFNVYGEVDETTKYLARFKAIYTSVVLLRYAHDQNDQRLVKAAREALILALLDE